MSLDETGRRDDLVRSLKRQREKIRRTKIHKLVRNEAVGSFRKDLKKEKALVPEEYKEDPDDCVM